MTDYKNRIVELRYVPASDLEPHPGNWRDHPREQVEALKGVLADVGIADALLAYQSERTGKLTVIDGHLRKDAAPQTWPVLVLDVTDKEADFILATHDPLAALAQADAPALQALLDGVNTDSKAVQEMLSALAEEAGLFAPEEEDDGVYTRKIESPVYMPKGEQPDVADLYDDSKTQRLVAKVEASSLPEDVKRFLTVAAQRHTVIDFRKVAEYYAHADAETQEHMEDSALVIIDFDRAIELGHVRLSQDLAELAGNDE